jgi:hypothetical protein
MGSVLSENQHDGLKMGADHMYTVDSRWLGLERARNGWDDAVTK